MKQPDAEVRGLAPLDTAGVLWVAAIDLLPIEKRISWVEKLEKRVAHLNELRANYTGDPPGAGWSE